MLSIAHAVSGAFIASTLPNPLLYAPLALACHFAEDFVTHWDFGTGMSKGVRKIQLTILFAILDLLVAALLIALFWHQTPTHFDINIWFGAFFGILPDLLEAPALFLKKKLHFLAPLSKFHDLVHHSTPNMFWGLLPQILVVVLIGYLALT